MLTTAWNLIALRLNEAIRLMLPYILACDVGQRQLWLLALM